MLQRDNEPQLLFRLVEEGSSLESKQLPGALCLNGNTKKSGRRGEVVSGRSYQNQKRFLKGPDKTLKKVKAVSPLAQVVLVVDDGAVGRAGLEDLRGHVVAAGEAGVVEGGVARGVGGFEVAAAGQQQICREKV